MDAEVIICLLVFGFLAGSVYNSNTPPPAFSYLKDSEDYQNPMYSTKSCMKKDSSKEVYFCDQRKVIQETEAEKLYEKLSANFNETCAFVSGGRDHSCKCGIRTSIIIIDDRNKFNKDQQKQTLDSAAEFVSKDWSLPPCYLSLFAFENSKMVSVFTQGPKFNNLDKHCLERIRSDLNKDSFYESLMEKSNQIEQYVNNNCDSLTEEEAVTRNKAVIPIIVILSLLIIAIIIFVLVQHLKKRDSHSINKTAAGASDRLM